MGGVGDRPHPLPHPILVAPPRSLFIAPLDLMFEPVPTMEGILVLGAKRVFFEARIRFSSFLGFRIPTISRVVQEWSS